MRKYRFVVVDDRSGTRDRCSQNNVDYEAKGNVNRETKSLLNIKDDMEPCGKLYRKTVVEPLISGLHGPVSDFLFF